MENMMTVQEVNELTNKSALFIRKKIENGEYVGEFTNNGKRKAYSVSRYWLYTQVLFWPEWKIKEYHNSTKGKMWLSYDPKLALRKKESASTDSIIVN